MSGEGRSLTCTQQVIKSYSVTQLYLLKTIFVFNTLYFRPKEVIIRLHATICKRRSYKKENVHKIISVELHFMVKTHAKKLHSNAIK
jgi:hypothetical protein